MEVLRSAANLSVLGFAISSMLSAGLSFTFREITAPFRRPNRILRAIAANFVLVPLLAAGIARAFSLGPAQSIGVILLGSAAGAPFLIKLVAVAAGDVALGTSLLVLLVPLTVVLMPIVVPLLAPEAAVTASAIALPLVATLLFPLALGLCIREAARGWARTLQPIAGTVSTVSLIALLVLTLVLNVRHVIDILASRTLVALLLFLVGSFVIGYALASPRPERRIVLGLGTAQRNIAAATVVATEDIKDRDTLVLVVVASIIDLTILIPVARWLRARAAVPHGGSTHDTNEDGRARHARHRTAPT